MTPEVMAEIYAAAFPKSRAWTAAEFEGFVSDPFCFFSILEDRGFALGQIIAGEVELLTIALKPEDQGQGLGRKLLNQYHEDARSRGARVALLEVAEDNISAKRLYQKTGYSESGRRKGYYRRTDSSVADAVLMRLTFSEV